MIKERKKTARVPIIFLTAHFNEDQHVLEGYGTGAVDYLLKPVNPAILRSKVSIFAELHRKSCESAMANRGCLLAEVAERRRAQEALRELNDRLEEHVTKRTEALRESEERLRLAIDAAAVGSWDWNMLTGEIVWNPLHEILFGYQPGTPQRTYADFQNRLYPEDVERVDAAMREAIEQNRDFRCEFRVVWPDGSIHWVAGSGSCKRDLDGVPIRMLGVIVDITERKRRERNLAFLADLQKDFAPRFSAQDIMRVSSKRIAEHLGLSHCCLAEIDETADQFTVVHDHHAAEKPSLVGVYHIADFHTDVERRLLADGETLVINNVRRGSRAKRRTSERFATFGVDGW